jgi:hypothetical protein
MYYIPCLFIFLNKLLCFKKIALVAFSSYHILTFLLLLLIFFSSCLITSIYFSYNDDVSYNCHLLQNLAQRNPALLSKPGVTLLVLEILNYRLLPLYR